MAKTLFEINNYRKACKFLQNKYDKLGYERKDYYHATGADNHLTKTNNIGHGKDGLQYHHICEDLVPSLSNKEIAAVNPIEYQKAENMCYCNLLEHAWLHILITENNTEASDEDDEYLTGLGGVQWMMLALNSIMCNAGMSWYSSKNEEGRGCDYNVNNIITDHKDDYKKVINRFCTSAFIRQRLNKTSAELALLSCISCKKDGSNGGLLNIYDDILKEANTTLLFDWNVNAYADLENYLKNNQSALVYICTGGGKTTTGLEYLRVHNAKALALGPGDTIGDSWLRKDENGNILQFNLDHVDYENYQSFMNDYKTINWSKYQVVLCDEAHHVKADRWGEGIRWLLENHPEIKIIGLTATPTTEQFGGTDKEFGGRICYGLDLANGIKNGQIWPFNYITSIYKMEDVKDEFNKFGTSGRVLWEKLNIKLNENPIENILKKHMPTGQRKIIVFCSSIKDLDDAETAMLKYSPNLDIRRITSKQDKDYNDSSKKWFNKTVDHDVCLITVSMVNEGAHYDGVNTLVMFRRTNSATLYLQQLGRVVVTTKKDNPNGIVFDFTNNAENLIYNSTVTVESTTEQEVETETIEDEKQNTSKDIEKVKKELSGKEVIHKDYTEDCVATLNTLKEAKDVNKQSALIFTAFNDLRQFAESFMDIFDFDIWKELKTAKDNVKIDSPKHATSKNTEAKFDETLKGKRAMTRTIAKISDVEKIATAFRLAIRRLYNFGYISFEDNHSCAATILNDTEFNSIVRQVGFKKINSFKDVMNKLEKHIYLIAVNI